MKMQKIQVCLLAIIAVALVYIAVTYTNANRYVPLNKIHGTLDTRTGNVYTYGGKTFYLHKNGYSTLKVDWRDYAGTDPQPNKQAPYNKHIVDEILKGN